MCESIRTLGGDMKDLTPEEIEELHSELLVLNEELQLQITLSEAESRPVDLDAPIGRLSRMDAIAQQNVSMANRRAAKARVERIKSAIQRIVTGEYGTCLSCGELIGLERLKVQPEAPFCIACQSQREARGSVSAIRPSGRG